MYFQKYLKNLHFSIFISLLKILQNSILIGIILEIFIQFLERYYSFPICFIILSIPKDFFLIKYIVEVHKKNKK